MLITDSYFFAGLWHDLGKNIEGLNIKKHGTLLGGGRVV